MFIRKWKCEIMKFTLFILVILISLIMKFIFSFHYIFPWFLIIILKLNSAQLPLSCSIYFPIYSNIYIFFRYMPRFMALSYVDLPVMASAMNFKPSFAFYGLRYSVIISTFRTLSDSVWFCNCIYICLSIRLFFFYFETLFTCSYQAASGFYICGKQRWSAFFLFSSISQTFFRQELF